MVPSSAGINEDGIEFKIFSDGNQVNLTYSAIEMKTTFSLYGLDGKLVYTSNIESTSTSHAIPSNSGVYIYKVVTGDRIITGKIQL